MQFQECFNDMLDLGCPIFTFVTEDIGIGANVNKCYAAPTLDTYAQYGLSTECSRGKPNWPPGGIIANEVYQIKGNVSDSADFGLLFEDGDGNDIAKFLDGGECLLTHNHNTKLQTTSSGVSITGEVDATSLDISGDADIDGTLEADAITVNGTALNTVIADESTALAIALG